MMIVLVSLLLLTFGWTLCTGLDNGLAATPPMGWMSGERFQCNIDCQNYPQDCISEKLVKTMADTLVDGGFKAVGYEYMILGDCWMALTRDPNGRLQADPQRFPSGMKMLADYVHQKGLKLGVYMDIGNTTCYGYPGSMDHLQLDAQTVAQWGVDMVEMDGCSVKDLHSYDQSFPEFGAYLNKTGRPILYLCDWPVYQNTKGIKPNYPLISKTCNLYRTYKNMSDSWLSLHDTIKYYGDNLRSLVNFSVPGSWNDPDTLLVGNYGMSVNQQQMQMVVWSIMNAPLFVSSDLRRIPKESRGILLNKGALGINQDPLGIMGVQVAVIGQVNVWKKPILPKGSFALVLLYTNVSGGPKKVSIKLSDIHLTTAAAYQLTELFTGKQLGTYKPWYTLDCEVNPTGVMLLSAIALP